MGKQYRDLVRQHSKAKGSARAVLNILADYATDDGLAWPGRETLAQDTGLSERTVTRCLQMLCDQGRLTLEENASGGRGRTPHYKIHFPELLKGDNVTPNNETDCHPLDAQRVTNGHVKGDNVTIKGDNVTPPQSYVRSEPQEEPTTEPEEGIAADAATPATPSAVKSKPKRSRKRRDPPNTSGDTPPREPTEWQEFVGAFCWLCHNHKEVRTLTKEQQGALLSEARKVHEDEYTVKDLKEWYKQIWPQSWQWKKDRRRPNPSDVRSTIAQLRAETPEGFDIPANGYHANGTSKVAGSLAALDQYDEIKLRHGVTT